MSHKCMEKQEILVVKVKPRRSSENPDPHLTHKTKCITIMYVAKDKQFIAQYART